MKNIKVDYEEFLNERFFKPNYTKEKIKDIIAKAKTLIPKEKIDSFIEDNKEEIQEVSDLITDENGEVDFGKVKEFMKSRIKK